MVPEYDYIYHQELKSQDQSKEKSATLRPIDKIVRKSVEMQRVIEKITQVAAMDSPVLIHGESGTGKELIASAIHAESCRRDHPRVVVNCGSIPEDLLERELFGHDSGVFASELYQRKGKLEIADSGTLCLREIADMSERIQMDILAVLKSGMFTRLKGDEYISSDFRLICATKKDLEAAIDHGEISKELYSRISVSYIFVPPLRERRFDIIPLVESIITRYVRTMNKPERKLSPKAREIIMLYHWPGNVRELENAIEHALAVGTEEEITPDDLPHPLQEYGETLGSMSLEAIERKHIQRVLKNMKGNVTRAARILGINRVTLYNKIEKYGIER